MTSAEKYIAEGDAHYQAQRFTEAMLAFKKAEEQQPGNLSLRYKIAVLHWVKQNHLRAIELLESILEQLPNNVQCLFQLALANKSLLRHDEAISLFKRVIELDPENELANLNLAVILQESGAAEEAAAHLDDYEAKNPSNAVVLINALILPIVLKSSNSIKKWRDRVARSMRSIADSGRTIADPLVEIGKDHFPLGYHGQNDRDLQIQIANSYARISPSLSWQSPFLEDSGMSRRIKVGFVSSNLRGHTIGHLNLGYIQHLDRSRFEVCIISDHTPKDPMRERIESEADSVTVVPRNLEKARNIIANLKIDILFFTDIGMGMFTYFLAFSRLAPVQAVSWGHPVTTGIPTIDHFVSCDLMEPDNAENAYSENLVRLPDVGGYLFEPQKPDGSFDRQLYGLPSSGPLIACLQSCFKFHPDFDLMLKRILEALPEVTLVLLHSAQESNSALLRRRLEKTLGQAASQVAFVGPLRHADFLKLAMEAKAVLDIPQWSGGRSSYECLALGVPIVHKPGDFMRGRHTLAFYTVMGVSDCIVDCDKSYVRKVIQLVRDSDYRNGVSSLISSNCHKLFKRESAVRALEEFFLDSISQARSKL